MINFRVNNLEITSSFASCSVCESKNVTVIEPRKHLKYFRCNSCGHCATTRNSEELSIVFQESQSKYYGESTTLLFSAPPPSEVEILSQRKRVLSKYLRPDCEVAEVGPGAGRVLSWLISKGYSVSAFEHSPVLTNQIIEQLGVTVINGEFEELDLASRTFDAICSFHVIEHSRDPYTHLRRAFSLVRPGGLAFIATPNSRSWQQIFFESLSPNFDSAHLWVFSSNSLKILSQRTGWEIVTTVTPETTVGWLRVLTKGVRRFKNEDEETTAGKYALSSSISFFMIFKLIQAFTYPLRLIQSKLGYGNEVFLVLRKPLHPSHS